MQEIILTIGLPASGKSTWADEFIRQNPEYVNVNRDDIRLMMQGRDRYAKFSSWREGTVTDIQKAAVESILNHGKSVIISDTNLDPNKNQLWKDFAQAYGYNYREELFTDTPLGVCLSRDAKREHPVSSRVITGMFERYRDIYWPKPKFDARLPNAYIVDVDGTVAKMNGRRPFDWDRVGEDLPKEDVIRIIQALAEDESNHIIICSGRDGVCEQDTREWLIENNVPYDAFFIRPAGSNEKDYIIKQRIYDNHIRGRYNVLGVFDDRDQVVHVWRQLGLTCLQVDYGDF